MTDVTIDDFYTHEQLTEKLRTLVDAGPDVASLSSIGESRDGRELWCVTLGDRTTEPPVDDRPAILLTANLHARELAGSWAALSFVRRAVAGESERLADLLTERTFYVVPRLAPDGADHVLATRTRTTRSRHVPLDDGDLRPDDVRPEDLTGDGRVLSMRWRAPDGEKTATADGRLLVSRTATDDGPFYRQIREGTVPKYRGERVREPNARSDFNRNFPTDEWERFDWIGHGKYPLSEPETRAIAEFCFDHPNVVGNADLHTGNPAVFYPTALRRPDPASADDADLVEEIGRTAADLTGFPYLASYDETRGKDEYVSLPGSFKDFLYEHVGVPAFVLELGLFYNYLGLDTADLGMPFEEHEREWQKRALNWHDDNPEYGLFQDWESVDHPQLGSVEVGGWDWVCLGNPPTAELPDISDRVGEFVERFATWAPDVVVASAEAERLDGSVWRVAATVVNQGSLPTNVTKRGEQTHPRSEPRVTLDGPDDCEFLTEGAERRIDHLSAGGGSERVEWVVRTESAAPFEIDVQSPRGVRAEATVDREGPK